MWHPYLESFGVEILSQHVTSVVVIGVASLVSIEVASLVAIKVASLVAIEVASLAIVVDILAITWELNLLEVHRPVEHLVEHKKEH